MCYISVHDVFQNMHMQSKSAIGPSRDSNMKQPGETWMFNALLGLRLAKISDTVRKHVDEIMSTGYFSNIG